MDENLKNRIFQILEDLMKKRVLVISGLLLGLFFGVLFSTKIEQSYYSSQTISLQDEQTFNALLKGVSAPLNTKKTTRTAYSVITTEPVLFRVALQAKMLDSLSDDSKRMSIINKIRNNIEISTAYSESEIVTITYNSNDKKEAKNVVEIISKEYINEVLKIRAKTATLAIDFLKNRLDSTLEKLKLEEKKLENLKKKYLKKLPDLFMNQKMEGEDLETQLFNSKVKHQEVKKRYEYIKNTLNKYNSVLEETKLKYQKLKTSLRDDLKIKSENHPDVIRLTWQIDEIKKEIKQISVKSTTGESPNVQIKLSTKSQVEFETNTNDVYIVSKRLKANELELEEEMLRAKIEELAIALKSRQNILNERPTVERDLKSIQSKLIRLRAKVRELKSKHDEANNSLEIAIMDAKSGHSIVAPANLPLYSRSPKAYLVWIIGMILGLVVSITSVVLINLLNNTVYKIEDAREVLDVDCIAEFENYQEVKK